MEIGVDGRFTDLFSHSDCTADDRGNKEARDDFSHACRYNSDMNALRRCQNYIQALMGAGLDKLEDPETLLAAAQHEVFPKHQQGFLAIRRRNALRDEVAATRQHLEELGRLARAARTAENAELAATYDRPREEMHEYLQKILPLLRSAEIECERIKAQLRNECARLREGYPQWGSYILGRSPNVELQPMMRTALSDDGAVPERALENATTEERTAQ